MRYFLYVGMNYPLNVVSNQAFFECSKSVTACYLRESARAGM